MSLILVPAISPVTFLFNPFQGQIRVWVISLRHAGNSMSCTHWLQQSADVPTRIIWWSV